MKKESIYYDRSFRGVKQLQDFYAKAGILERAIVLDVARSAKESLRSNPPMA